MTTHQSQANPISRRHVLAAAGVLGLGVSLGTIPRRMTAHQATDDPLAGMTVRMLCAGESSSVSGKSLLLRRVTLEPGVALAPHSHPGPVALFVESGRFGTEFVEGHGVVTQKSQDGLWDVARNMLAGEDVTMYGGDHLFYDSAIHTMRNDGEIPAVLLVSTLIDTGAEEFIWHDRHGSPGPYEPR